MLPRRLIVQEADLAYHCSTNCRFKHFSAVKLTVTFYFENNENIVTVILTSVFFRRFAVLTTY